MSHHKQYLRELIKDNKTFSWTINVLQSYNAAPSDGIRPCHSAHKGRIHIIKYTVLHIWNYLNCKLPFIAYILFELCARTGPHCSYSSQFSVHICSIIVPFTIESKYESVDVPLVFHNFVLCLCVLYVRVLVIYRMVEPTTVMKYMYPLCKAYLNGIPVISFCTDILLMCLDANVYEKKNGIRWAYCVHVLY